jgi:ABC-type transport system substrate-binding protein
LPPSLLAPGATSRELVLDRAGALRLLGEAGFPQGLEAEMLVTDAPRPYLPTPSEMAQALREQLAVVGIRLSLRPTASWTDYLERASRGDYELALLGWQADSADPADFLSALLSSEAAGATNRSRYRSPDLDAVLKRARRESGPRDREAAFREAESLFQRDMPFVPLFHVPVFTAYRVVLQGVVPGPTGLLRYDKTWKLE